MTYKDFRKFVNEVCIVNPLGEIFLNQPGSSTKVSVKCTVDMTDGTPLSETLPVLQLTFYNGDSAVTVHSPKREDWIWKRKKAKMLNTILQELEQAGKEEMPGPSTRTLTRILLGLEPDKDIKNLADLDALFQSNRLKGVAAVLADAYDIPQPPGLSIVYGTRKIKLPFFGATTLKNWRQSLVHRLLPTTAKEIHSMLLEFKAIIEKEKEAI